MMTIHETARHSHAAGGLTDAHPYGTRGKGGSWPVHRTTREINGCVAVDEDAIRNGLGRDIIDVASHRRPHPPGPGDTVVENGDVFLLATTLESGGPFIIPLLTDGEEMTVSARLVVTEGAKIAMHIDSATFRIHADAMRNATGEDAESVTA